jgi:hypothetical protein
MAAVLALAATVPGGRAHAEPFRVFVNGQEVTNFDVSPFEDTPRGRLMVQVRPVLEAMGCKVIQFVPRNGTVVVDDACNRTVPPSHLVLYPRDESPVVRLLDGFHQWAGAPAYRLDARVRFVNGMTVAPGRLLADAFNCYSWWDPSDSSLNIDCGRPAGLHQNLSAVMATLRPRLAGRDFTLDIPDGGIPMYPSSWYIYNDVVRVANEIIRAATRNSAALVGVDYEDWNGRARLYNRLTGRTFAYIKGDMIVYPNLSVDETNRLAAKIRRDSNLQSVLGGLGVATVVLVPGMGEIELIHLASGLLSAALSAGARDKIGDADVDTVNRCVNESQRAMRAQRLNDDDAQVSVATRFGHLIQCIPRSTGDQNLDWQDYIDQGVNGGVF